MTNVGHAGSFLGWHGRRHILVEKGPDENKDNVGAHQGKTGAKGSGEQIADRQLEDVAENDQDNRRRNNLSQGAGGADGAGGQGSGVAVLEHNRQGDDPHGHHRGADHAGGGGQQGADQDRADGNAAPYPAKQGTHGLKQPFRQLRTLQDDPHEDKEGDRHQDGVVHD